jgi:ADP-ribosyl-[dinitrogen reductase] hydrolase
MITLKNYQGALLGLAVGDALGATTENMRPEQIKDKYGVLTEIIGGGWLRLKAGQTTDDTDMTLAVAEGILHADMKGSDVIKEIGERFLKWIESLPVDVGAITGTAIYQYKEGKQKDWMLAGKLAHRFMNGYSAGNGSLMRCLPIALAYHDKFDYMEVLSDRQSRMTHYDYLASDACILYNRIAKRIINGEDLKDAIIMEIADTRYENVPLSIPVCRPSGYVVDTFAWVISVLLDSNSFEEVVVTLANMGSDSDTTGAIAGGLAGLYYGLDAIPERFTSKILLKDKLMVTAEELYNIKIMQGVEFEEEDEYEDHEPRYNCRCGGAGACIQCNPSMFI